jgi:hypothetical protein
MYLDKEVLPGVAENLSSEKTKTLFTVCCTIVLIKKLNNSWGRDKGNHYRVGGFICDKKIKLIYILNFSFVFLGLDNVYF